MRRLFVQSWGNELSSGATTWQRLLVQKDEILSRMFLRFYNTSLKRRWLKDPESACTDAIYRMSILIAGPLEFVGGSLIFAIEKISGANWSRAISAIVYVGCFLIAQLISQGTLKEKFLRYSDTPDVARQYDRQKSLTDLTVEIACFLCILGFLLLILLSTSGFE
jgi:hypothetical protein